MRPHLPLLIVLSVLLCACENQRALWVNADGSAEIRDRLVMHKDSGGKPQAELPEFTREEVAEQAAHLGEGVKLTAYQPLDSETGRGYEAVYSVADVRKVRVEHFLQQEQSGSEDADRKPGRFFGFKRDGAGSELIVPLKDPDLKPKLGAAAKEERKEAPSEENRKQTIEALRATNIRCSIHISGTIQETNATYREGNDVVLQEINTKGWANDPANAKTIEDLLAGRIEEPPPDEHYLRGEAVDELKVRFQ